MIDGYIINFFAGYVSYVCMIKEICVKINISKNLMNKNLMVIIEVYHYEVGISSLWWEILEDYGQSI